MAATPTGHSIPASVTFREDRTMQGMARDEISRRSRRGALLVFGIALGTMVAPTTSVLGQDEAPVTLRLAVADQPGRPSTPGVEAFVAAANELSGGSVTVEPIWDAGVDTELGFEQGTAKRLVDGDVELALAASRAWEPVGIGSFRALQAPFLIDDDALAVAVAQSDAATGMLDSLSDHGLTGLALWPEDLRHPATILDCAEPIVSPEQFAGLTVRVAPSGVSYDLFETLGATPTFDELDGCTIQATESGLTHGASLPSGVTFTGDVTFFPKFQILAASSGVLARLSEEQRQAIRGAALAARDAAIGARVNDADAVDAWCAEGGRVVLAGPDGVAAFQAAAQPVYERLSADPVAAEAIAAIRALKERIEPAPSPIACGTAPVPGAPLAAATGPTPIDGTYVTHVSLEDLSSSPLLYDRGEINDENWGDITLTLDSGSFALSLENPSGGYETSGTYTVEGDLLTTWDPNACCPSTVFSWRWRLDGDTLYLTRDPAYEGPTPWIINPWTRVPNEVAEPPAMSVDHGFPMPDTSGFSGDLPPDGRYRVTADADELMAAGASPGYAADNAGTWTWTFTGNTWDQVGETNHGPAQCSGTLTSDGASVRMETTPGGTCGLDYEIVWRLDGDAFLYRLVDLVQPEEWTLQDWLNEQAWYRFPMQRLD
jgi:TRAP-type C4-dicarboxylate transport system substrate-binding protein